GPIGLSSATVTGSVTPNAGFTAVRFEFGTTTKYGAESPLQYVSGVTSMPVTVKLSRLKLKTTYHYRLIVGSMDGSGQGVDRTFKTAPTPVIGGFKIKPRRFRAGGKGATITYTDSQASKVRFAVLRAANGVKRGKRCVAPPKGGARGPKCTRSITVGN